MKAFAGRRGAFLVVLVVCVAYLALRADRGWIPHDEGLLGQSAERILHGELPHRDFDDTYTGGLAMLHAAAFRALGVELTSIRLVLLLFSCAFILVVYRIAARVTPPAVAGLVTLACVSWSVPNYFASLPSWYNLFFATFGTAALLRHIDTGRRRWLFIAGLSGGLAIVIKTIGLYYVGAALLYLLYREQLLWSDEGETSGARRSGLSALVVPGLVLFVAATSVLVSVSGSFMAVVQFVLPAAALCGFLAWNELQIARGAVNARVAALGRMVLPFAAGVALPCVAFVLPYAASGSVGQLLHGAFVLPQQRFEFAVYSLPSPVTMVAVLPLALLLFAPLAKGSGVSRWLGQGIVLVPVALLLAAGVVVGGEEHVYRAVWYSVRPAVVVAVAAGAAVLVSATRSGTLAVERRLELFLVLAMAALISLVQFPYAFGIYFCYAAPFIVLAVVFVAAAQKSAPVRLHMCLLVFYLAFAVVWLNRGFVRDIGGRFTHLEQDTQLDIPRAGLRVSAPEADLYRRLVQEIQAHSSPGAFIYATPDCPQVYFLADRRNPTRTFYEFFDADYDGDPETRRRRILDLLDQRHVDVVVVSWQAEFSRKFDPGLIAELVQRFPNRASIAITEFPGPASFTVRWR